MKVLIWCGYYLLLAIIFTIIRGQGYILGGLPTAIIFGLGTWAASATCKAYDKKNSKEVSKTESKKETSPQKSSPSGSVSNSQFSILKVATSLATLTINAIDRFDQEESSVYLCYSNATKTDTILFSCFVLRAICIMSTENQKSAMTFSREYVSDIRDALSKKNVLNPSFDKIFNERTKFYDKIFMSKQGIDKKLSAIGEEFEYIITNDIINSELAPFYEDSPLPILGLNHAVECRMEVSNYIKFLLSYTDKHVDQAIASIQ